MQSHYLKERETMNKSAVMSAILQFINQRPGLEFANYGDVSAYQQDSRRITKDKHHAERLASYVMRRDSITAADIIEASKRAYAGRLTINSASDNGESFDVDYCTGQYFPTEYRRAAACVLACAIWERLREDNPGTDADRIRKAARRELGNTLAREFFN